MDSDERRRLSQRPVDAQLKAFEDMIAASPVVAASSTRSP
jgi:hypothetical protein